MRRALKFVLALIVIGGVTPSFAAEIVDRILSVVNNTPVLLSEWDEAWRCEALLADRAPDSYTQAEQQEIYNRMVDQELIRQQMRGYLMVPVSDADVAARVQDVRTQLSGTDEAKWQSMMRRAGVTESELRYRLREQMEIERFINLRFRAGIHVEDRAITRYYYDQLLPELRKAGGSELPLGQFSDKIREIILQQRMSEQVVAWVQTLREQADISVPQEINQDTTEIELTQSK